MQEVAKTASDKKSELEAELAAAREAAQAATAQVAELREGVAAAEAARDEASRRSQKLQQKADALKCVPGEGSNVTAVRAGGLGWPFGFDMVRSVIVSLRFVGA